MVTASSTPLSRHHERRLIALIGAGLTIFALLASLYLVRQRQDIRQDASTGELTTELLDNQDQGAVGTNDDLRMKQNQMLLTIVAPDAPGTVITPSTITQPGRQLIARVYYGIQNVDKTPKPVKYNFKMGHYLNNQRVDLSEVSYASIAATENGFFGWASIPFTTTTERNYTFGLKIDDNNRLTETNENNNDWQEVLVTGIVSDSTGTAAPGDFNEDGLINLLDFSILRGEFGRTGANLVTDMNHDQAVNLLDFTMFINALKASD